MLKNTSTQVKKCKICIKYLLKTGCGYFQDMLYLFHKGIVNGGTTLKITDFFSLLGGLALFLYGMQMMSNGLEAAAGNKMKQILERLTSNRLLGVLVGAGITAVIQSSSATTVMVVGFVNAGMMTLKQTVGVIMGANIGTTITGQLIALDIGAIAPLLAFAGVALMMFVKKQKVQHWALIVAGLGVLFIGMDMMSNAMMPLRDNEAFISLMTKFTNPFFGILAGMVFTAIIQSSSASVGILQALAVSGVIGLPNAVYVLFGQNIGTCITAVLASIGANRNAKRTTIIHLCFNIIGTIIFTIVCMFTPLTAFIESLTPTNVAAQIANMHTLFNIVTTILLFPFGTYLANLATKVLPDKPEEREEGMHLKYIPLANMADDSQIGQSAMMLNAVSQELARMLSMTQNNVKQSFEAVRKNDIALLDKVEEDEEYIDFLNKEISRSVSKMMISESNPQDSRYMSALFKVCGNLERIGDHAVNLAGYTRRINEQHIHFTPEVIDEIVQMEAISNEALDYLKSIGPNSTAEIQKVEAYEQEIDDMTENFRQNQMNRMQSGQCSDEASILYSEMLTDFERIGDHILNVGQEMSGKVSE